MQDQPLTHLTLILTYLCQLKCPMCGEVGGPEHAPNSNANHEHLDFALLQTRLNELQTLEAIYLFGGEPMVYPDFFPLVEYALARGLQVEYSTNGILLPRHSARIAEIAPTGVCVSIDSHRPEVHDHIRRRQGVHDQALQGLRALIGERTRRGGKAPFLTVHCTIQPENYREITAYLAFFNERFPEVDRVCFHFPRFATKEMGDHYEVVMRQQFATNASSWRGGFSNVDLVRGYRQMDLDVLADQVERVLQSPRVRITGPVTRAEIERYFHQPEAVPPGARCACFHRMAIQPNGDVVNCADYPDLVLGNIRTMSLRDIWTSERRQRWQQHLEREGYPGVLTRCSRLFTDVHGPRVLARDGAN